MFNKDTDDAPNPNNFATLDDLNEKVEAIMEHVIEHDSGLGSEVEHLGSKVEHLGSRTEVLEWAVSALCQVIREIFSMLEGRPPVIGPPAPPTTNHRPPTTNPR